MILGHAFLLCLKSTSESHGGSPGCKNGKVACELIDCILLAHTVMGSMAKDQVVLGKLDVLFPHGAEAVGVKLIGVCEALQSPVIM